jgi:nucleoside-diphosphate-sugar epimerase
MRVLIIGAAGMVGCKLARKLACDGVLGAQEIDSLSLVDVLPPTTPPGVKSAWPTAHEASDHLVGLVTDERHCPIAGNAAQRRDLVLDSRRDSRHRQRATHTERVGVHRGPMNQEPDRGAR